jgi:hypothetical protein
MSQLGAGEELKIEKCKLQIGGRNWTACVCRQTVPLTLPCPNRMGRGRSLVGRLPNLSFYALFGRTLKRRERGAPSG